MKLLTNEKLWYSNPPHSSLLTPSGVLNPLPLSTPTPSNCTLTQSSDPIQPQYSNYSTLIASNQFASRCLLYVCRVTARGVYFPAVTKLPLRRVLFYTGFQLMFLALIFLVTFTKAGIIFPILIAVLVPVRLWLVPKLFSVSELDILGTRSSPIFCTNSLLFHEI